MVEQMELKTLVIDLEAKRYLLNGKKMNGVSKLSLEFDNGKWVLLITKDEMYTSSTYSHE